MLIVRLEFWKKKKLEVNRENPGDPLQNRGWTAS